MAEATTVVDPAAAAAAAPAVTTPAAPADPFALDEAQVASLSPEQRAALDPVIDGWRKKATEEIGRRESDNAAKYKPLEEKAQALDRLSNYQPFVQWWQTQQRAASQGAPQAQQAAIAQTKPQDIATQQEWQEAVLEASSGDGTKLQQLQSRMMSAWATPFVQQITQKQKFLETQIEVKDLFERHPDAKDLDGVGLDPKTKEGVSLLEMGLEWAERNGKTLEDGYRLAKQWADQMKVSAQQSAMGMVQGKKDAVSAGPGSGGPTVTTMEVASADELIKKSLEAQLAGNKDVRFVIKGR